jgi:hypothetical protein
VKTSRQHYPEIANSIIDSEVNISSAGGEHQKFTVYCAQEQAHVLVKFSPKGNSDVAIRWRDILLTEYYANKILNTTGFITAAQSNIIESGDRLFLESVRFDRSGEYGRRSMISLKAIAMEFSNIANNWLDISQNLLEQKLISSQDEFNMQVLWHFGKLIHNTDMHPGNLSFAIKGEGFSLLPVYDMCSMGFAPQGNAEVRQFNFNYPDFTSSNNETLRLASDIAHNFWSEIYQDDRISVCNNLIILSSNPCKQVGCCLLNFSTTSAARIFTSGFLSLIRAKTSLNLFGFLLRIAKTLSTPRIWRLSPLANNSLICKFLLQ